MMPDMIMAIIAEGDDVSDCFKDEENCILSDRNPDGIPAWKMFSFNFGTDPDHPLGAKFTLFPRNMG
jgi:hypothetical protein